MNRKILAAATLAIAFVPAIANADQAYADGSLESGASRFASFVARLIIPEQDPNARPVAYADNPQLIGHRPGSTNPAQRK